MRPAASASPSDLQEFIDAAPMPSRWAIMLGSARALCSSSARRGLFDGQFSKATPGRGTALVDTKTAAGLVINASPHLHDAVRRSSPPSTASSKPARCARRRMPSWSTFIAKRPAKSRPSDFCDGRASLVVGTHTMCRPPTIILPAHAY